MKIVICGGHLTPAISVIEELSSKDEIYYFGRKFALEGDNAISLEYKSVTDLGIPFVEIKTGRIQRKLTRHTLPSLLKTPVGLFQSLMALSKIKPDIVVGFGGYISVPVCFAAWILKIPVLIHEQTQDIGEANKLISKFAKKICISFESSKSFFPNGKTVLTGNPIRKGLFSPTNKIDHQIQKPIIYVTGGSLGSHVLNKVILDSIEDLLKNYTIIHQTGSAQEFNDYEAIQKTKENLDKDLAKKYIISKFFTVEEVGEIFKLADLIVSRSGINTISELITFRKPAILIPLPFSQRNEQLKNAMLIKKVGLGEIIEQKDLSAQEITKKIDYVIKNLDKYTLNNTQPLFPRNSAKKIVEEIYATTKTAN